MSMSRFSPELLNFHRKLLRRRRIRFSFIVPDGGGTLEDDSLGRRIRKDLADNVQVLVPEGAHDNYFVCHTNWGVCGIRERESAGW